MAHISFKVPDSEKEFLKWFAEKTSQPIGVIYRNATIESFQEWKGEILLDNYKKGEIGFKQLCRYFGQSFMVISLLLQQMNIEPPISEIMDEYTTQIRRKIMLQELFKEKKIPKRDSPPVFPNESES